MIRNFVTAKCYVTHCVKLTMAARIFEDSMYSIQKGRLHLVKWQVLSMKLTRSLDLYLAST